MTTTNWRWSWPRWQPEPPKLLEPEPPEPPDPEPVTCSPTVRLTEATVPEIVDVSEASARSVCADERADSADVTDASSESIWVVSAPAASSLDNRAWADASCACAELTSAWRAVVPDGRQDLARGHHLTGLDVDGGHDPGHTEIEVGLAGRLQRPRGGDGLLDRARRRLDHLGGHHQTGRRRTAGQPETQPEGQTKDQDTRRPRSPRTSASDSPSPPAGPSPSSFRGISWVGCSVSRNLPRGILCRSFCTWRVVFSRVRHTWQ